MANFSGTVKIADLDDFLAPSQACIKPLIQEKKTTEEKEKEEKTNKNKGATVKIEMEIDMNSLREEEQAPKKKQKDGHFSQIKTDSVRKNSHRVSE